MNCIVAEAEGVLGWLVGFIYIRGVFEGAFFGGKG